MAVMLVISWWCWWLVGVDGGFGRLGGRGRFQTCPYGRGVAGGVEIVFWASPASGALLARVPFARRRGGVIFLLGSFLGLGG